MNIKEGRLDAQGLKIAIIVSRFNSFITEALLSGAQDALIRHGLKTENLDVYKIPGAYEMPLVLKHVAKLREYDGAICLGAVIRGDTPHFDFVAAENAKGIQNIMLKFEFPVVNGVLTTNTLEQAVERAGVKAGNKGFDAAMALIELIRLLEDNKS